MAYYLTAFVIGRPYHYTAHAALDFRLYNHDRCRLIFSVRGGAFASHFPSFLLRLSRIPQEELDGNRSKRENLLVVCHYLRGPFLERVLLCMYAIFVCILRFIQG